MKDYSDEFELGILGSLLLKQKLFDELMIEPRHFIKYREAMEYFIKMKKKYNVINISLLVSDIGCPKNLTVEWLTNLVSNTATVSIFHDYQQKQFEIYKNYYLHLFAKKYTSSEISEKDFVDNIEKLSKESIGLKLTKNEHEIFELITTSNKMLKFSKMKILSSKVQFVENTFNIIAARPSVGKSAFALNLLQDLSQNYNCLYFNMEMTEKEIYERLVAIESGVPINDFHKFKTEYQMQQTKEAISRILKKNLKIVNGSKTIEAIRKIILSEQKNGHTIVFIDYIGYVNSIKKQNDRERIGEVARELQLLTKDYDITMFCLAQINREGEDEPSLQNLKDSGELEQSGHAILLLQNISSEPLKDLNPKMKIIVAKNRSWRKGFINMTYHKENQQFKEIEDLYV